MKEPEEPNRITPQSTEATTNTKATPSKRRKKRKAGESSVSAEERQQILELRSHRYGMREIALRVSRDRKTVRRILEEEGIINRQAPDQASKLDPFRETIREKVAKRLTAARILREIRQQGYTGGRSILTDYIRSIRAEVVPRTRVKRRFETRPAEEMQVDWTVYTVAIAHAPVRVHASCASSPTRVGLTCASTVTSGSRPCWRD